MNKLSAFLILFDCGHTGRVPNLGLPGQTYHPGDVLHCYDCNASRTIKSVQLVTATEDTDDTPDSTTD